MAEAAQSREAEDDIAAVMVALGAEARAAARVLAGSSTETRTERTQGGGGGDPRRRVGDPGGERGGHGGRAAAGLSGALLDRLALDPGRVEAMASGVEQVAALDDPLGRSLGEWERPNGLRIRRFRCPSASSESSTNRGPT